MGSVKIATTDDFSTQDFVSAFSQLETFSQNFVNAALRFGLFPSDYSWPIDPVHNWSRIWEYPYVWKNFVKAFRTDRPLTVVDYGSGLTFFPWFLASRGHTVLAVDLSSSIVRPQSLLGKLSEHLGISGTVRYVCCDVTDISIADSRIDAISNISIFEHIQDYQKLIAEAARILKPGGIFVSTLDVTLDGLPFGDGFPLSLERSTRLLRTLSAQFDVPLRSPPTIPKNALRYSLRPSQFTHSNGLYYPSLRSWWRWRIQGQLLRPALTVIKSRMIHKSISRIPGRVLRFLMNPHRLDMWTVMGMAVQKSSIRR